MSSVRSRTCDQRECERLPADGRPAWRDALRATRRALPGERLISHARSASICPGQGLHRPLRPSGGLAPALTGVRASTLPLDGDPQHGLSMVSVLRTDAGRRPCARAPAELRHDRRSEFLEPVAAESRQCVPVPNARVGLERRRLEVRLCEGLPPLLGELQRASPWPARGKPARLPRFARRTWPRTPRRPPRVSSVRFRSAPVSRASEPARRPTASKIPPPRLSSPGSPHAPGRRR